MLNKKQKQEIQQHDELMKSLENGTLQCPFCKKGYVRKADYSRYVCDTCGRERLHVRRFKI